MRTRSIVLGVLLMMSAPGLAWCSALEEGKIEEGKIEGGEIEAVVAHPPFATFYACSEHWLGQVDYLGDALGQDCVVQRFESDADGRGWSRMHANDGRRNEDWYGWRVEVLSPCDCEVVKLIENPVLNEPGILGKPPASFIALRRDDGLHFLLAHIQEPSVKVGERVRAGQPLARVGNNGFGRAPHLHIGAWRGKTPLQIRWDLRKLAALMQQPDASDK